MYNKSPEEIKRDSKVSKNQFDIISSVESTQTNLIL